MRNKIKKRRVVNTYMVGHKPACSSALCVCHPAMSAMAGQAQFLKDMKQRDSAAKKERRRNGAKKDYRNARRLAGY